MTEAEMWKDLAKRLALNLNACLNVGLCPQSTQDGEKIRLEVEDDSWRVLREWRQANGRG